MKYMLQVRFAGADVTIRNLPVHERDAELRRVRIDRTRAGVLDGNQLQPADTATTVRVRDGQTETAHEPAFGPPAALDGYYLCDSPDLHTARTCQVRPSSGNAPDSSVRDASKAVP